MMRQMEVSRRILLALGLVLALATPTVLGQDAAASTQALEQVEVHLAKGAFGRAMASASRIEPEAARARQETLILYNARSYDAALDRALVAIDGGQGDELLLLNAVRASIWILDTEAAVHCQGLLEERLEVMTNGGAANLAWWTDQVVVLSDWVDGMVEQDAATDAVVGRARATTFGVFGVAVSVLFAVGFVSSRRS